MEPNFINKLTLSERLKIFEYLNNKYPEYEWDWYESIYKKENGNDIEEQFKFYDINEEHFIYVNKYIYDRFREHKYEVKITCNWEKVYNYTYNYDK